MISAGDLRFLSFITFAIGLAYLVVNLIVAEPAWLPFFLMIAAGVVLSAMSAIVSRRARNRNQPAGAGADTSREVIQAVESPDIESADVHYKYFENPHRFSAYSEEPQACDLCKNTRSGYQGPFYGESDIEFVCEPCLYRGHLQQFDTYTNEPAALSIPEIRAAQPELTQAEAERNRTQCKDELIYATPLLTTWQDFLWPAHCGDFCRCLGEVGKHELNALAPDEDGKAFFVKHLGAAKVDTKVDEVWPMIPDRITENKDEAYTIGVYLFRCLRCGEHAIHWDAD